jgi:hypothetical protein
MRRLFVIILLTALAPLTPLRAATVDVAVGAKDISISPSAKELTSGTAIRIYIVIRNLGIEDTLATVSLRVGAALIGQADPIPARAGGTAQTWIDWVVPAMPFKLTAIVEASDDTQLDNNQATTAEFKVIVPQDGSRDIFSPPLGRDNLPLPSSSLAEASSTLPTSTSATTTPEPVEWNYSAPQIPPAPPAPTNDLNGYTWIPYLLIALGAMGFAWGMRGRRHQYPGRSVVSAPLPVVASTPVKPRRRSPARPKKSKAV